MHNENILEYLAFIYFSANFAMLIIPKWEPR